MNNSLDSEEERDTYNHSCFKITRSFADTCAICLAYLFLDFAWFTFLIEIGSASDK